MTFDYNKALLAVLKKRGSLNYDSYAGGSCEYQCMEIGEVEFFYQSRPQSLTIWWKTTCCICICGLGFAHIDCDCEFIEFGDEVIERRVFKRKYVESIILSQIKLFE